jgi:uncharacterized membrane-anchored protein YitT (DUF2179 family)
MIRVSLGLFLGMFMSALASKVESLGDYAILAKVANEKSPPISSINRALMMEGKLSFIYLNHFINLSSLMIFLLTKIGIFDLGLPNPKSRAYEILWG